MIVEAEVIGRDYNGLLLATSKGQYFRAEWPETGYKIGYLIELDTSDPLVWEIK